MVLAELLDHVDDMVLNGRAVAALLVGDLPRGIVRVVDGVVDGNGDLEGVLSLDGLASDTHPHRLGNGGTFRKTRWTRTRAHILTVRLARTTGFSPETLESLLLAASEGTDWNSSFGFASTDMVLLRLSAVDDSLEERLMDALLGIYMRP